MHVYHGSSILTCIVYQDWLHSTYYLYTTPKDLEYWIPVCLFAKLGLREPQAMLKFSNYWCVSRSSNITIIIKWIKFKSIIDTLQKNCFYLLIYTSIYWAWKILWLNHEIKEHVAFDMYGTYIDQISVTIIPVPINSSVYLYYTQNLIKWYPLNYNWPFIHI